MVDVTADDILNWVSDFCQSDTLTLFPTELAPLAPAVLEALLSGAHQARGAALTALSEEDCKDALLGSVARIQVPAALVPVVPSLCRAFLEDLQRRGRIGNGHTLGRYVGALKEAFAARAGGRQAPYERPGSKIGRNDPCPCGSGRKFKKCCGRDGAGAE